MYRHFSAVADSNVGRVGNDNQEIDWEILTSTIWNRSECVLSGIWAVNQVRISSFHAHMRIKITLEYAIGRDARAVKHKRKDSVYFRSHCRLPWCVVLTLPGFEPERLHFLIPEGHLRFQWSPGATAFYIDGQRKTRFTTNVRCIPSQST